ncbi:protein bicaudal C homolog 1-A isoform X1, partial [Tachysurus ichikawai]
LLGSPDLPAHNGSSESNPALNGLNDVVGTVQSSNLSHTLSPLHGPSLWTNTPTTSANTSGQSNTPAFTCSLITTDRSIGLSPEGSYS